MFENHTATFEVHGRQLLGATGLPLRGGRVHGLIGRELVASLLGDAYSRGPGRR